MSQLRGIVRGQVRGQVRGNVRSSGETFHDGISFNAATGRVIVKAPGAAPQIGTLSSFFTVTGGNQTLYRAASGLLVPGITNTPRIEFNASGSVRGLLVEASKVQKGLNSEDLSAAGWAGSAGCTVSVNAVVAPDGNLTADKLVEDGSVGEHRRRQTTATTAGATVTASVFGRAAENPRINIRALDAASPGDLGLAVFDLTTGSIVVSGPSGAATLFNATMEPYANGFYRCVLTVKPNATMVSCIVDIFEVDGVSTTTNYAGDSASGNYIWGYQFEEGASASAYKPSTAVAVTGAADSSIKNLGAEFSATAGTVVVTGTASPGQDATNAQCVWEFNDATANNRIVLLRVSGADTARYSMFNTAVQQGPLDATFANLTPFKAGIAWAANDLAFSFNGGGVATDATASLPTVTKLELGSATGGAVQGNCWIKTFDYYPTRLSNAQLQQMSA